MSKSIDVDRSLPRSWEMRYVRPASWELKTSPRLQIYQRWMDPLVDLNFNCRRFYRRLKESYGYLTGPFFFGIPFCVFYLKGLRVYQRKLNDGKIRYRYRAPEHLRLPPKDLNQQPPWNSQYVAPLRCQEKLSTWQLALEHGSRMCPNPVSVDFMKNITDNREWQKPTMMNNEHPEAKRLSES